MKITSIAVRNFRRLENVKFTLEEDNTLFVGPNNSGKTSAASVFRYFLGNAKFSIHDFTVSAILKLDRIGMGELLEDSKLPAIELDIWFSINPDVEFGRVSSLLPNVSEDIREVGIRLKYKVNDESKLLQAYRTFYPEPEDSETPRKKMADYLMIPGNLSNHFSMQYSALEKSDEIDKYNEHPIDPKEARQSLASLLRVDFVDAQRNIHDQEEGRSNRLSAAFASFYKRNLEQKEASNEANKVIDENNKSLTEHYDKSFEGLLGTIASLGVPSVNDRTLRLVSDLKAEEVLRGNTELFYVDEELKHDLPESYNGLGFKNLVFMAIQVSDFLSQWIRTETDRPLCQLIITEEPEVHLHAQVQQTFIKNIQGIIKQTSEISHTPDYIPQLVITTHSSHILDTVEFSKIRYFQRCKLSTDSDTVRTLNATKVKNLKNFKPAARVESVEQVDANEILDFLKKYLKLVHCDLFFADAAILVEGNVERLLIPQMVDKVAPSLQSRYLTILEVGGAYAHRFAGLLGFLGLEYLVITDIDSVNPNDERKACKPAEPGSATSNGSIKYFFNESKIAVLNNISDHVKFEKKCYIAFQKPINVEVDEGNLSFHGRTFEESFVYENLQLFKEGKLEFKESLEGLSDASTITDKVYDRVKSDSFKKTEFAMSILSSSEEWKTPDYIKKGLEWLEKKLNPDNKGGTDLNTEGSNENDRAETD